MRAGGWLDSGPRSLMSSRSTRHRVALAIALLGLAVSGVVLYEEMLLGSVPGHSAFCTLGGIVDCDVVLSSRYGTFLDLPVGIWALATFGAGALFAIPGAFFGVTGGLADVALIALASGAAGFSLVLAGVMAFILRHVCLLCLSLDIVVLSWLVTVLPLARTVGTTPPTWLATPTAARAAGILAMLSALAAGTVSAVYTPPPVATAAELESREPAFVSHYRGRPVVAADSVLRPDAATKGRADAPVTIVEFSDFQCPACGQAFRDLHELLAARTDVRLVFRNFPLDSACNDALPRPIHPDACNAAIAAECARQQSRFWEYHDVLFANQRTLDRDSLFRYARDVGIDIATFRTCLDDPATRARISEDARAGIAAGVESTPTLFINGRRIDGALERAYYDYALVLEQDRGGSPVRRP
jgi:protein-disulfide isomerase/uncharacterized membrane protein